jgi:hypothetical protein
MDFEKKKLFPYSQEPAHPMILEDLEDLIAIYELIHAGQEQIDKAFDQVSRQIGFIVVTTLPIVVTVGEKGTVTGVEIGSENLKGTLFQKDVIEKCLAPLSGKSVFRRKTKAPVAPRGYNLLLVWEEALALKLRTDWMEPAHAIKPPSSGRPVTGTAKYKITWEAYEPAHWFDADFVLDAGEKLQIQAIDAVYTSLKLSDRISMLRNSQRGMM